MNKIGYQYYANIAGYDLDTYVEYKVQANDTVGNWATSTIDAYTVVDTISPTISLLTEVSDTGQNVVVPIEAEITDAGEVKQVLLSYSLDTGVTFANQSMSNTTSTWTGSIPMGLVGESVHFSIYAEDQSGNWTIPPMYSYLVNDVIAPKVNFTIISYSVNQTDMLHIEVEITDDSDLLSVVMRFTVDDWQNESELLLSSKDGVWVAEIQVIDAAMTMQYQIVVEDTAHNVYESPLMFYTLVHKTDQISPLNTALVATGSAGIGVVAILLLLYLKKRNG
jgi:hypothetical protein